MFFKRKKKVEEFRREDDDSRDKKVRQMIKTAPLIREDIVVLIWVGNALNGYSLWRHIDYGRDFAYRMTGDFKRSLVEIDIPKFTTELVRIISGWREEDKYSSGILDDSSYSVEIFSEGEKVFSASASLGMRYPNDYMLFDLLDKYNF